MGEFTISIRHIACFIIGASKVGMASLLVCVMHNGLREIADFHDHHDIHDFILELDQALNEKNMIISDPLA